MRPLLQLFHVSDLHIAKKPGQAAVTRRWLHRMPIYKTFKSGTAGHDYAAFRAVEKSIADLLHAGPEWRASSWLIATGDLSTWGDTASVQGGVQVIAGIANRLGIAAKLLYGNHDVWPDTYPFNHSEATLIAHRDAIRGQCFPCTWPLGPWSPAPDDGIDVSLPNGGSLEVCSLDTILHERIANSFAYGEVREDWYWTARNEPDQLLALQANCGAPAIRVVLTHHPVHYPAAPRLGLVLRNAAAVATALQTPVQARPLASIVLSGHTHEWFPLHGQLPRNLPDAPNAHQPLGADQLQLIVGTLSQRSWNGAPQEHSWQLLRFWWDSTTGVVLERIIYTRNNGVGPFRPLADDLGNVSEIVQL